ncbi:MAG: hypothetical protein C0625_05205 [Arcobacter sp.]|nr:MAG: hypothetical protein C0625_05205 [Arcobacter sp.]
MKKLTLLLIFIFFTSNVFAKQIEAKYNISYGNFLDLGEAITTLEINGNDYKIVIAAKTIGMAKFLTNNREEIYESYGKIINNEFIPKKFVKIKKDNYKKRTRTFNFDYKNNKVLINDKIIGKEKIRITPLEEKYIPINKELDYDLNYFAKNDILSLFFNLKNKIKTYKDGEEYTLKAIGANKTKGIINILIPSAESFKKLAKVLKTDDKSKFTVFINQKIFQSEKGELLISLNKEGFCSFAILKDVLFFGDIVGEMVDFKINKG